MIDFEHKRPVPYLDASKHKVTIGGAVAKPQSLTVQQLRSSYRQHSVTCALQCAGNRRHTMRTKLKEVSGIDWYDGAVMNCTWRGPLLGDVLRSAGVVGNSLRDRRRDKKQLKEGKDMCNGVGATSTPQTTSPSPSSVDYHVAFASYQTLCQDDTYYGSSIPLARALRPSAEVILALDMNGKPLTPARGFPVRVVAPGIAGARAVKWLDQITVQDRESPNFYQQRDYKILPPEAIDAQTAQKFWPRVSAIQDMPVNSVVAVPKRGQTLYLWRQEGKRKKERIDDKVEPEYEAEVGPEEEPEEESLKGTVFAKGYALPAGEDGPITRVEVSGDGGVHWKDARLIAAPSEQPSSSSSSLPSISSPLLFSKWAWTLWEADVPMIAGTGRRILCRATDSGGNEQPACSQWNFRGVAYNGYGEVEDLTVLEE